MSLLSKIRLHLDYASSWRRLRKELLKHDQWINEYAQTKGYRVNPNKLHLTGLKIGLEEAYQMFGKHYCACFEPTECQNQNESLVCPCAFAEEEIKIQGHCHCGLFGQENFSPSDFSNATRNLTNQYRSALNLDDAVLDCRGIAKDPVRKIELPSTLQQVKLAFSLIAGDKLTVLVDNATAVENLRAFADLRGYKFHPSEAKSDLIIVGLSRQPWVEQVNKWQ